MTPARTVTRVRTGTRVRTVGRLLRRSFAVLVLLLVASSLVGLIGAHRQNAKVRELSDHLVPTRVESNQEYDALLRARSEALRRQTAHMYAGSVASLGLFTALGLVFAVMTATRTTRKIVGPLGAFVSTLDRLGAGDHDARAPDDGGPAEIRAAARAVNAMADELDSVRRAQADLIAHEQRLVSELRDLDRVKTEFLSTISHELRTPLTSISGFTELLRDADVGPVNATQDRMLETIDRNTDRLRNLIEDLLTLARIEAGVFQTVRERTDLRDIVEGAVRAIRAVAHEGVRIRAVCPETPVIADVDRHQIDRLLMNLLSNAVKFTPHGGKVRVELIVEGQDAVLAVSDTGIGIPDADQGRLFNRFFRAANAIERSIPGTGLGLTIVRTIVLNHDGTLQVASKVGEGTTFRVRLPVAVAPTTHAPRHADRAEAPAGRIS